MLSVFNNDLNSQYRVCQIVILKPFIYSFVIFPCVLLNICNLYERTVRFRDKKTLQCRCVGFHMLGQLDKVTQHFIEFSFFQHLSNISLIYSIIRCLSTEQERYERECRFNHFKHFFSRNDLKTVPVCIKRLYLIKQLRQS